MPAATSATVGEVVVVEDEGHVVRRTLSSLSTAASTASIGAWPDCQQRQSAAAPTPGTARSRAAST